MVEKNFEINGSLDDILSLIKNPLKEIYYIVKDKDIKYIESTLKKGENYLGLNYNIKSIDNRIEIYDNKGKLKQEFVIDFNNHYIIYNFSFEDLDIKIEYENNKYIIERNNFDVKYLKKIYDNIGSIAIFINTLRILFLKI